MVFSIQDKNTCIYTYIRVYSLTPDMHYDIDSCRHVVCLNKHMVHQQEKWSQEQSKQIVGHVASSSSCPARVWVSRSTAVPHPLRLQPGPADRVPRLLLS